MRIYAVADIHADAARIEVIRSVIAENSPDVLVVAGDILNYINPDPVFRKLDALPVPVLAVRGNSDPFWQERLFRRYPNIASLHANKIELHGYHFAGIGGCIPVPFRTRFRLFERGLLDRLKQMMDHRTVLVVHPPPRGILDRVLGRFSAGSAGVRELISECAPQVVICGHIHEDAGFGRIGGSLVVNCSFSKRVQGAIITLDAGRPPSVRMLEAEEA